MSVIVLTKSPLAHFHCQCIDINTLTKFRQLKQTPVPQLLFENASQIESTDTFSNLSAVEMFSVNQPEGTTNVSDTFEDIQSFRFSIYGCGL